MNDVLEQIQKLGIVPVVVLDRAEDAYPVAKALCDGGLPVAEVTFRTAAAKEAIEIISREFPKMLVGAGTVLTTQQVDDAVAAGAKFIVSPGLNPKVVQYCIDKNIPVAPGCSSPSDIEMALSMGLDTVKFFPAEASGGIKAIKAMAAPYTSMKFMPTGGINASNLMDYLSFKKVIACGGSWMVSKDLVNSKNFDEITRLTREAVMLVHGFELLHVGINCESVEEAGESADYFEKMFGFAKRVGPISSFAGKGIETMNTPGRGTKGHIAIACNDIHRAIAYFAAMGVEVDETSFMYNDKKELRLAYLPGEVSGFAVHLSQK